MKSLLDSMKQDIINCQEKEKNFKFIVIDNTRDEQVKADTRNAIKELQKEFGEDLEKMLSFIFTGMLNVTFSKRQEFYLMQFCFFMKVKQGLYLVYTDFFNHSLDKKYLICYN